jgi:hypothetical protein
MIRLSAGSQQLELILQGDTSSEGKAIGTEPTSGGRVTKLCLAKPRVSGEQQHHRAVLHFLLFV